QAICLRSGRLTVEALELVDLQRDARQSANIGTCCRHDRLQRERDGELRSVRRREGWCKAADGGRRGEDPHTRRGCGREHHLAGERKTRRAFRPVELLFGGECTVERVGL